MESCFYSIMNFLFDWGMGNTPRQVHTQGIEVSVFNLLNFQKLEQALISILDVILPKIRQSQFPTSLFLRELILLSRWVNTSPPYWDIFRSFRCL